jgi:hypothetical protein
MTKTGTLAIFCALEAVLATTAFAKSAHMRAAAAHDVSQIKSTATCDQIGPVHSLNLASSEDQHWIAFDALIVQTCGGPSVSVFT